MKTEKLQQGLLCALLSFCLSFGCVSCMVTGLELDANLIVLGIGSGLISILFSIILQLRYGGRITLTATACLLLLGLCFGFFRTGILSFVRDLVTIYTTAYELPVPPALEAVPHTSADLALVVLSGIVSLCCSFTVLRQRRLFLVLIPALLCLATCFVFTDTVPALWCIVLWFFSVIMLLLTQFVRRHNSTRGLHLAKMLALPVAAALLAMCLLIPPDTQNLPTVPAENIEGVWNWFLSKLPYVDRTNEGDAVVGVAPPAVNTVQLEALGPRNLSPTPVMEITPQFSGSLYLRGQDFDRYTGLSWQSSPDRQEDDFTIPRRLVKMNGTVRIKTFGRYSYRFIPGYPNTPVTFSGGYAPNTDFANEYSLYSVSLLDTWKALWRQGGLPDVPEADARYLELPENTRARALSILRSIELFSQINDLNKATAIERYVKESARYDLNAEPMPEDAEDFAIWFLQEAETGYCVHFATAATVLLRAAGIPARYVEGYHAGISATRTTIVRANQAHAWVEYHLEGVGWVRMDPTPSGSEVPVIPPVGPTVSTTPPGPGTTRPTTTLPTTQPSTTTLPTTQPDVQAPLDTEETPPSLTAVLTVLSVITGLSLIIIVQWYVRCSWKKRALCKGSANAQAIARYKESVRLAKLSGLALPEQLTALAEKAAFSQHQLTRSELSCFNAFLQECVDAIASQKPLRRLWLRLIFAAY